jgi:hypothetical protein
MSSSRGSSGGSRAPKEKLYASFITAAKHEEARRRLDRLPLWQHGTAASHPAAINAELMLAQRSEEEASEVWHRAVQAILESQPESERTRAMMEDRSPAVEAGMLLISYDDDQARAWQYAAKKRDEAIAKSDDKNAEKWQQVIVCLDQVQITARKPERPVN